MMYKCDICGARLDPDERCDCTKPQQGDPGGLALQCVQAPVISEDLDNVRRSLDAVLCEVAKYPVNDDSLKQVKKLRAELSKRFTVMEDQRKEVKRQVLQPYVQAEEKYKACIADPYRAADRQLKDWIDGYQNGLKSACEARLQEYFDELCQSQGVDFLRFFQCGVAVDMAMARQKEPRKAMDTIHDFVMGVRRDLDTILTLEDGAEVLTEYRESLDLSAAILAVQNRKTMTQRMAQQIEAQQEGRLLGEQHRRQLLDAMKETGAQPPAEDLYTMTFTVTGTMEALKALKTYILSSDLTIEEDIK